MFRLFVFKKLRNVVMPIQRTFRAGFKNPYLDNPMEVTEKERQEQNAKPVWERKFDPKKYLYFEGNLKASTGMALLDVEPFPRLKLMKLYYLILQESEDLPDKYGYKLYMQESAKYRMEIVDETPNIREIEEKINYGIIEELIIQAHNHIKLIRILKEWQPWNEIYSTELPDSQELLHSIGNLSATNPFTTVEETYKYDKNERPSRKDTAGIHEDEEMQPKVAEELGQKIDKDNKGDRSY